MNQAAVPLDPDADPDLVAAAQKAMSGVNSGWRALFDWTDAEFRRLAAAHPWAPDADVPLVSWLDTYPGSPSASRDAFRRFTGYDPEWLGAN